MSEPTTTDTRDDDVGEPHDEDAEPIDVAITKENQP